jgi:hypothetical protein
MRAFRQLFPAKVLAIHKTFTLRGIKERPRCLHHGRRLTPEDTVAFFNLVLGLQLAADEKRDPVAFLKVL